MVQSFEVKVLGFGFIGFVTGNLTYVADLERLELPL